MDVQNGMTIAPEHENFLALGQNQLKFDLSAKPSSLNKYLTAR